MLSELQRFMQSLKGQLPTASQYYQNGARGHLPTRAAPLRWWTVLEA